VLIEFESFEQCGVSIDHIALAARVDGIRLDNFHDRARQPACYAVIGGALQR
jgi:hypothetical protein